MQTSSFIKVANPTVVDELKSVGFSAYMKEQINGVTVFVFTKTPELISCLESHFARSDFFNSNKLHF